MVIEISPLAGRLLASAALVGLLLLGITVRYWGAASMGDVVKNLGKPAPSTMVSPR